MAWLLNTQLCPLIWALILGLLAMLVYKVGCHPPVIHLPFAMLFYGCIVLAELPQQRSICFGWVCHMCMACTSVHCTRVRSPYECLDQVLHCLQVVLHPEFGAPPKGILAWTWVTLILASAGLVFLYKTTTADPGFLPCGVDERVGKEKVRRDVMQLMHSP